MVQRDGRLRAFGTGWGAWRAIARSTARKRLGTLNLRRSGRGGAPSTGSIVRISEVPDPTCLTKAIRSHRWFSRRREAPAEDGSGRSR